MNIAFHIPSWVLWTIGIAAGVCLVALAAMGVILLKVFGDMSKDLSRRFGW